MCRSTSEKISFYILIALLLWVPIPLASNRIWAWSLVEMIVSFQSLILFSLNWKRLNFKRLRSFLWILLPLFAFQVWVAIQMLPMPIAILKFLAPFSANSYTFINSSWGTISVDVQATMTGFIKGVTYFLFCLNSIILINSLKRIKVVLYTLVISGTFQAFYGAVIVLMGIKYSLVFNIPEGNRVTGSFVYYNHLANYLLLCLCLGTGLIVAQMHQSSSGNWRIRIQRWLEAILSPKMLVRMCLIIMVIGLVMTRSRMGNAAFFSVTLLGGVIALIFYKNRPRALTVLVISIILIDTFVVGTLFGLEKVKQRIESTSVIAETRDQAIEWGSHIIQSAPLTGSGLGSFYSTFPMFTQYNIGYYNFAHNEYIQFASEVGIPATLVLGSILLVALVKSFKAFNSRNSKTLKGTALGCFMAICGEIIHILVDFNLQAMANTMTFLLVLVLAGITKELVVKKNSYKVM